MTAAPSRPVLVVEDDPFLRFFQVILDPSVSDERVAALAHFLSHDLPDFEGWRDALQSSASGLYPAEVRLVSSQEELRAALPGADAVVVESLDVRAEELALGDRLRAVQKFGTLMRNVDVVACATRGLRVLAQRRRANISCAEHTIGMMLAMARKFPEIGGLISVEQLTAAGYTPAQFDRRHTAMSGWPRVPGLRMLYESSLGILGLGEIGRELARRIAPFEMTVRYHQRTRLTEAEERSLNVSYATLPELLAESDWLSIQLPLGPETRGFLGREELAMMKPGAVLINTSRAEIVDQEALLDALRSGHLGGLGLDPLYEEPGRADDPLLTFPNVFLTPHTAAQPRFNVLRDVEEMIAGLARALRGPVKS